jgi:hypothetical protein
VAIWGLILFISGLVIVCVIVARRGRAVWPYALFTPLAAVATVPVVASAGGSEQAAGVGFFVPLIVAFVASVASRSGATMAAETGSYRGMRKCPQCAEAIRAEAIKCKHCGSEVAPLQTDERARA